MAAGTFLAGLIAAATLPGASAPAPQPQWLSRPSGEDIARLYPPKARERVLSGRVVLACVISASGRLQDCRVVEETPRGYGFGEAALRAAGRYVVRADGPGDAAAVVGRTVNLPVAFTVRGWVDLRCGVDPKGRAKGCRAVGEHPPGRGFGALYARAAEGMAFDPEVFRRRGDELETTVSFDVPVDPSPDS